MRILYASERPPYPFFLGGAARSAHYLLSELVNQHGVKALAVGSGEFSGSSWSAPEPGEYGALGVKSVRRDPDKTIVDCPYPVQVQKGFASAFAETLDEFQPDVVWTQLDGILAIASAARAKGIRVLVFLRDAENPPDLLRVVAETGCGIVCNSAFMANRVKRITGKEARVIYPTLEAPLGVTGDPNGFITMVNPSQVKGVETFWQIARRMRDENFLLVESWNISKDGLSALHQELADLPNVWFVRRLPNVEDVYRQTKLLLVPSVWEEAFGRVVIEAQSCGIPVIASNRGGLGEAVGDGGICIDDYKNARTWVEVIRSVLSDPGRYNSLRKRAHQHANSEAFTTKHAARVFLNTCRDEDFFRKAAKDRLRRFFGRLRANISTRLN